MLVEFEALHFDPVLGLASDSIKLRGLVSLVNLVNLVQSELEDLK
jgi:hypothetical protein